MGLLSGKNQRITLRYRGLVQDYRGPEYGQTREGGIVMFIRRLKLPSALLAGALALGTAGNATGAGFAIIEHSAQGMGNAFAGGGAVAEDASSVWFNPASITRLPSQMQASGHVIMPTFEFTDRGSVQAVGPATIPLLPTAPTVNDGGKTALVPNFYYIRKFNERISFGLAVNAPFGLATEYDANWKGRYQAVESEIVDLNVNPVVAYKLSDSVSIGGGVSANYIDAKLTNAVDFAAVCAVAAGGACPNGAVPGQGAFDGFAEIKADDISFGFNFGIFYEPTQRTRLSFSYRSQINHKLDGKATFTQPTALGGLTALGPLLGGGIAATFANDGAAAGVSLPDTFSFGMYHRLNQKIGLMGDITWTNWATIPELRIVYDRPTTAGGPTVETLNWRNTYRFSLGMSYYYNDRITMRTGLAYDESPVPNPFSRTARLPDNDRLWLSIGGSYVINDRLSADFGYSHLFIRDTPIQRTGSTGSILIGNYDSDADIISIQVNYKFR